MEATVKGVTEVIYPTEFTVTPVGTNTNTTVTADGTITEPGSFETREVGVILQVLPEVTLDGSMINLTMTPQVVYEPEWKDYGGRFAGPKGKGEGAKMEVPFFHTQMVTTSISIKDGATVLLGGGMPAKDPAKVVYAFVTARRVGLDGKPLKSAAVPPAK
jgi:general secretion pathway protein D